jgi:alpha-tubulin suppressor-like RCC1 family protein
MMVELDVVVRQVECGGLHTACVTEDGRVYTWGNGKDGELGHHHDPSMKQIPRQVGMCACVCVCVCECACVCVYENSSHPYAS